MKKKLFAIIMCVMMVMCFMPSMTFAETAYVAQIGEVQYETLQAAIDAVQTNQESATTITLLSDASIEATNEVTWLLVNQKKIIIDMNNHDIKLGENRYILVANGSLELTGSGTVEETVPQIAAITVAGGSSTQVTRADFSVVKVGKDVTV